MIDHRSPWQSAPAASRTAAALEADVSADVCVVGAGMAGLLCALELAERGRSVIVLDRAGIAAGDTSLTTAHLTAFLDTRYHELTRMHGAEAAKHVAASHQRALAHLERIANAYDIDCDFRRVSGFLCAAGTEQTSQLAREHEAASAAGIACEMIRYPPLPIASGVALHVPNQAQFDPLAFISGVERALQRHGVVIYAPAAVEALEPLEDGQQVRVNTSEGHSVLANHVIVATGSPINDIAALHTKQAAYRTYAVTVALTEAIPGLFWDMEDPYHYVRSAIDAATGQPVLIVGGEDHRVGQDTDNEPLFEHLETWLRGRFPKAGELVSQWSGQVFEPSDGLAFIGRNPGDERVFVVTGESGNGMTYSAVAAQLIADLVQGVPNDFAAVYSPSRKPHSMAALGDFMRENLNTAGQYADWIAPADVAHADDVAPGHGAVIRRGLRRVAIYRDEAGVAHELSATCPHLGGVVAWNSVEKSWDCPCHGSRFDCHGKVLTGPAVSDLSPAKHTEQ